MPTMQGNVSLAAGAINANVLAGSAWELPDQNYYARVMLTGDAAQLLRATLQVGPRVHLEESQISPRNAQPIFPDDLVADRVPCPKGQRIIIKARNGAGVAASIFWQVVLTPVGR